MREDVRRVVTVMDSSISDIEQTVSKPPRQRTDVEIRKLLPWFKQRADTFRSLKPGNFVNLSHPLVQYTYSNEKCEGLSYHC